LLAFAGHFKDFTTFLRTLERERGERVRERERKREGEREKKNEREKERDTKTDR
jgi:hypothetical protein